MKKLLKHLTNVPVAVALAFLLVGAPAAPMAKMLPSSGYAMAHAPCGSGNGPGGVPDADCDGLPDYVDPCPYDPSNSCGVGCMVAGLNDDDCDGLANDWDPCPNDAGNTCGQVSRFSQITQGWDRGLCLFVDWLAGIGLVYGFAGLVVPEPFVSKLLAVYGFTMSAAAFVIELAICRSRR